MAPKMISSSLNATQILNIGNDNIIKLEVISSDDNEKKKKKTSNTFYLVSEEPKGGDAEGNVSYTGSMSDIVNGFILFLPGAILNLFHNKHFFTTVVVSIYQIQKAVMPSLSPDVRALETLKEQSMKSQSPANGTKSTQTPNVTGAPVFATPTKSKSALSSIPNFKIDEDNLIDTGKITVNKVLVTRQPGYFWYSNLNSLLLQNGFEFIKEGEVTLRETATFLGKIGGLGKINPEEDNSDTPYVINLVLVNTPKTKKISFRGHVETKEGLSEKTTNINAFLDGLVDGIDIDSKNKFYFFGVESGVFYPVKGAIAKGISKY